MSTSETKNRFAWLLSPYTIFAAIFLGLGFGYFSPEISEFLKPYGKLYLSLLEMTITPILICAVVSSLGSLLNTGKAKKSLPLIIAMFVIGLTFASLVGTGVGSIGQVGAGLSESAQNALGSMLSTAEIEGVPEETQGAPSLLGFVQDMVPSNIFEAMAEGRNLAVLFFSILFGISLGLVRTTSGAQALSMFGAIYDALLKLLMGIMYGLPFGLICIFASQISEIGTDLFSAMFRFIAFSMATAAIMIAVYSVLFWRLVGGTYLTCLSKLKQPIMVALVTSSSFAAIPSALKSLQDRFQLDKRMTNLMMPLGVCLHQQGSAFLNGITVVFVAQLYGVELGLQGLFIAVVGAGLTAIAMSGAPGVGAFAMMAIVLRPLGLPVEIAIILLVACAPIVEPILTLLNVSANCTVTAYIAKKTSEPGFDSGQAERDIDRPGLTVEPSAAPDLNAAATTQ